MRGREGEEGGGGRREEKEPTENLELGGGGEEEKGHPDIYIYIYIYLYLLVSWHSSHPIGCPCFPLSRPLHSPPPPTLLLSPLALQHCQCVRGLPGGGSGQEAGGGAGGHREATSPRP